MKLPSVNQALQDARCTFVRFPFVIVDAALGTAAVLLLVDHEGPASATVLFPIFFAAVLGIPLLTALAITAEKKKWGKPMSLGAQAVGALLLVAYAFSVPQEIINAPVIHILRLLILACALHLFVAAAPFTGRGEVNGFWHYNRTMFLRILTAALYSHVLYAGLAIALAALDNLFGIHVPGKRYPELWLLINGLFTTWFFLAGVPEDLDGLDAQTDYPKGLKIFAQYILLPLVLIYLAILYAYLAKILVSWDWPQGWVSKLILGFSGTGIFSLLLLHPISGRTENVWIKTAARWFYVAMIPLVVMLFFAVWRRVSEYGFTEGRYLALALGVWLAIVVAYFIVGKARNIKVIPVSLCVFAVAVSFGPWGTFAIPEQSQIARLRGLLTKNAILVDGAVRKAQSAVSFEDTKQISSILAYLHEIHGFEEIQPWFRESLKRDSLGYGSASKDPALVAKMMGLEYVRIWQNPAGGTILLTADRAEAIDLTGYDRMLRAQHIASADTRDGLPGQEIVYKLADNSDVATFTVVRDGKGLDSLQINLRQVVDRLLKDYGNANTDRIPADKMVAENASAALKVKVCFSRIRIQREAGEIKQIVFDGDILYTLGK